MTFNAMTERYEEITVCGKPALFTSIRIKRDTVPDGLYPVESNPARFRLRSPTGFFLPQTKDKAH